MPCHAEAGLRARVAPEAPPARRAPLRPGSRHRLAAGRWRK